MLPDTRVSPTADLSKASPKRSIRAFAAAKPQRRRPAGRRRLLCQGRLPDHPRCHHHQRTRGDSCGPSPADRPSPPDRYRVLRHVRAGDVVLACQRWRIRSKSTGGEPFVQISNPILALRCIEDEWKLAIAAPWGWGRGVSQRGEEGGQREWQHDRRDKERQTSQRISNRAAAIPVVTCVRFTAPANERLYACVRRSRSSPSRWPQPFSQPFQPPPPQKFLRFRRRRQVPSLSSH